MNAGQGRMSKRFILEGRVQGVGCRSQVYHNLSRFDDLRGYVRNLGDGTVEVCVTASPARVEQVETILRTRLRPPVRVDRMITEELPLSPATDFTRFSIELD